MEFPRLSVPGFSWFDASFVINDVTLSIVFVLFFIVYLIISSILFYHWRAYGRKSHSILVAESLFVFVSGVLFVVAGLSVYYF